MEDTITKKKPFIPSAFNPRNISFVGRCGPRNIAFLICKAIEEKVSNPLYFAVQSSVDRDVRCLLLRELSGRGSMPFRDDSTGMYRDLKRNVLDTVHRNIAMKLRPPSQ